MNKIINNIHKSPNNKENFHSNVYRTEGNAMGLLSNGKNSGNTGEGDNRINLSPILALNRKLNEGPKHYSKKSLTPEGHKVVEEYERRVNFEQKANTLGSMHDSKGMVNYNSASNLRGSNCFKALIENRNKSPNRLENSGSKAIQRREGAGTPVLKESLSSNQLLRTLGSEKGRLSESRSYDQLRGAASTRLEGSEIKCMNNDGKKAKYRVLNNEEDRNEQGQLYFCSKCTIPLVQQGFIVEEIGREPSRNSHPEFTRLHDYRQRLEILKKNADCVLLEMGGKEEEELSRLEQYYSTVFEYLERQRRGELRKIQDYYKQVLLCPFRKNLSHRPM
jgi:hypothetical protein